MGLALSTINGSQTMAEVNAEKRATPKHEMKPAAVTKAEKRQSKEDKAEAFRNDVWLRDKSRCRATGVKLQRAKRLGATSEADLKKLGDVDHAYPRSTHPDRIYDVSNGLLLQSWLNLQRKVSCTEAPEFKVFDYEGPDDRSQPQRFIWRHRKTGVIVKERLG